jgi:hypothetical protein
MDPHERLGPNQSAKIEAECLTTAQSTAKMQVRSGSKSLSVELKDNWYFELSSDPKAKLPFARIEPQRLSCRYERSNYFVTAQQGIFSTKADSGLNLMPESGGLILDFSKR